MRNNVIIIFLHIFHIQNIYISHTLTHFESILHFFKHLYLLYLHIFQHILYSILTSLHIINNQFYILHQILLLNFTFSFYAVHTPLLHILTDHKHHYSIPQHILSHTILPIPISPSQYTHFFTDHCPNITQDNIVCQSVKIYGKSNPHFITKSTKQHIPIKKIQKCLTFNA